MLPEPEKLKAMTEEEFRARVIECLISISQQIHFLSATMANIQQRSHK